MLIVEAKDVDRRMIIRTKGKVYSSNMRNRENLYGICGVRYSYDLGGDRYRTSDLYIRLGLVVCEGGILEVVPREGRVDSFLEVMLRKNAPYSKDILHAYREIRASGIHHIMNLEMARRVLPLKRFVQISPYESYKSPIHNAIENDIYNESGITQHEDITLRLHVQYGTTFTDLKGNSIDSRLLNGNLRITLNPIIRVKNTLINYRSLVRDTIYIYSAVVVKIEKIKPPIIVVEDFTKKYREENPDADEELDKMLKELKIERTVVGSPEEAIDKDKEAALSEDEGMKKEKIGMGSSEEPKVEMKETVPHEDERIKKEKEMKKSEALPYQGRGERKMKEVDVMQTIMEEASAEQYQVGGIKPVREEEPQIISQQDSYAIPPQYFPSPVQAIPFYMPPMSSYSAKLYPIIPSTFSFPPAYGLIPYHSYTPPGQQ